MLNEMPNDFHCISTFCVLRHILAFIIPRCLGSEGNKGIAHFVVIHKCHDPALLDVVVDEPIDSAGSR